MYEKITHFSTGWSLIFNRLWQHKKAIRGNETSGSSTTTSSSDTTDKLAEERKKY